jgi:hypothetical protein
LRVDVDRFVSAEISDCDLERERDDMLHGPYPESSMGWKDRAYDNKFPKEWQEETSEEQDGYPNDSSNEDEKEFLTTHIRQYYWNRGEIRYL